MDRAEQDAIWRRIEREASAQAALRIQADENTPLVFGDYIAWVHCAQHALTDALSSVHRVGYPIKDDPYTTCGEAIPAPARWFTLSPRLVQTMPPCRFCEAEYARCQRENAA